MSGDALPGSSVGAENLVPDTFSNLARLHGLVSGQIDGLSSSRRSLKGIRKYNKTIKSRTVKGIFAAKVFCENAFRISGSCRRCR